MFSIKKLNNADQMRLLPDIIPISQFVAEIKTPRTMGHQHFAI
jgi:hypothetical protein